VFSPTRSLSLEFSPASSLRRSFDVTMDIRKSQSKDFAPSLETLNRVLARSSSLEELVEVDFLPCCYTSSASTSEHVDIVHSAAEARVVVEQRIQADTWSVYMLSFVQMVNLLFIYTWLSVSTERSHFILIAEVLLSFTPLSGLLGAYFQSRVWLETHHMTSMLLYCSPLFFAMAIWDVENLSLAGYAFFTYQICLLFYQYKALKVLMQLRRDIKLRLLMQSSIVAA